MTAPEISNALTVDVEDYFHVSAFSKYIDSSAWPSMESRVEENTYRLLEIFDGATVKATFFVLGWVAERCPQLVKAICAAGHELACHGYSHRLIYTQQPAEFREETHRARQLLEDLSGREIRGYRAASFSITRRSAWALEILLDEGFSYDSSIVPARHDLYGVANANPFPYSMRCENGRSIVEFPPSTIRLMGQRIPIGGGGYFRFFPYWFSEWGLAKINRGDHQPFAFYLHPWEVDPHQPRVAADWRARFRHYNNLQKCERRLRRLLNRFRFDTMNSVIHQLDLKNIDVRAVSPFDASVPIERRS